MPVARLASDLEIVAALPGVFDAALMMPTRRVVSGLRALGLRLSSEPEEALFSALRTADRPYYWLAGDAFLADGVAMVAGRRFTHAVSAAELAEDVLEAMPDFAGPMLDLVIQFGVRLPDGAHVRPFDEVTGGPVPGVSFPVRLPAGTLSRMGLRPGDLVGLSAGGWHECPELVSVGALDGDLLGPMLVRRLGIESAPLPVDAVVIAALALEQWPGGVQPPISQAAADAGLECDDRYIAPLGVPLGPAGVVRRDARDLAEAYELGRDEARVVAAALDLIDLGERVAGELAGSVLDGLDVGGSEPRRPGPLGAGAAGTRRGTVLPHEQSAREVLEGHQIDVGQLLAGLADPYSALVVAEEALEGFDPQVIGLGMLVQLLDQPGLPRPARAALDYLRGRQLEFLEGPRPRRPPTGTAWPSSPTTPVPWSVSRA